MDGLHAWSPDHTTLAYVASDANGVNVHVLSGGGDRVLASFGAVPGRGVNPNEDDEFIGFSPDGGYFAFEQTFTSTGNRLVVWGPSGIVFAQASATMATWGSTGSKLYFRQPNASIVYVWDSAGAAGNRTQAFGQQLAWQRPRADAGDDYLAFYVRDANDVPHVYLYGHGGRAGAQVPNLRSTPSFLNSATVFLLEEAPCGQACGIGPAIQPDGKTFTYSIATQTETPSTIASVLSAWPGLGQV
jgi:Tol biopolymer transport system component